VAAFFTQRGEQRIEVGDAEVDHVRRCARSHFVGRDIRFSS